jgi:hypothetical protein
MKFMVSDTVSISPNNAFRLNSIGLKIGKHSGTSIVTLIVRKKFAVGNSFAEYRIEAIKNTIKIHIVRA